MSALGSSCIWGMSLTGLFVYSDKQPLHSQSYRFYLLLLWAARYAQCEWNREVTDAPVELEDLCICRGLRA